MKLNFSNLIFSLPLRGSLELCRLQSVPADNTRTHSSSSRQRSDLQSGNRVLVDRWRRLRKLDDCFDGKTTVKLCQTGLIGCTCQGVFTGQTKICKVSSYCQIKVSVCERLNNSYRRVVKLIFAKLAHTNLCLSTRDCEL